MLIVMKPYNEVETAKKTEGLKQGDQGPSPSESEKISNFVLNQTK